MKLPKINKSETKLINLLLKYRHLTITQLQQLFNHKDSKTVRELIIKLQQKKYISVIKQKDRTKPYVVCLAQRVGHIFKNDEDVDQDFLNWLYKEKSKGENFIQRNLFLADCFLYFERNKEKGSELSFFTKQDLYGYDYFPDPLPDAYIDEKIGKTHNRYFLDYFDHNAKPGNLRWRIRYYFKYLEDGNWKDNTDNAPFPTIMFVCAKEIRMKYLKIYAKLQLEKSFEDVNMFVTLKDNIKFASEGVNIWDEIKLEEDEE